MVLVGGAGVASSAALMLGWMRHSLALCWSGEGKGVPGRLCSSPRVSPLLFTPVHLLCKSPGCHQPHLTCVPWTGPSPAHGF